MVGLVADLAACMPPPETALERMFAALLLQRTAWESLQAGIRSGLLTHEAATETFRRVVHATERAEWPRLPQELRQGQALVSPGVAGRVREFIDTHLSEEITLLNVSRSVGASIRTTTEEFRAAYGVTIHSYVLRRRLIEAVSLLMTGEHKVEAVSEAVGFGDKATLYRAFRKILQTTPGAVRREPTRATEALHKLRLPAPAIL